MFHPDLLCGRYAWRHIVTPLPFCAPIFVYFLYTALLLFKWIIIYLEAKVVKLSLVLYDDTLAKA